MTTFLSASGSVMIDLLVLFRHIAMVFLFQFAKVFRGEDCYSQKKPLNLLFEKTILT